MRTIAVCPFGAGVEQRAHDRVVPLLGRDEQRGGAIVVREVLVGAGVEQRAHDRVVPLLGPDEQATSFESRYRRLPTHADHTHTGGMASLVPCVLSLGRWDSGRVQVRNGPRPRL